jgi:hypothetical protein
MGNINSVIDEEHQSTSIEFNVEVQDLFVLAKLMRNLGHLPGVSQVSRIAS